jgi:L-aminopeptidase/D-esterase-like protein
MGADFDFQDRGVVGAGERSEGLPAAGTPLLFGGQFDDLFHGGQVGVVPAFRSWLSPALSAGAWGSGRGDGAVARGGGIGLASEELLFQGADAGVELLVLLVEEFLALDGPLMQGVPVGGLPPGLELLSQPWADRARSLGDGGS